MSTGILGGSFDPIHWGHLVIAEQVRVSLKVRRVLFVPAGQQWMKGRQWTEGLHRVEMVRLALRSNPSFILSKVEINRPGPSYTVETLALLQQQYRETELFFILGWDALEGLPSWREPGRIMELARLVAVPRPGFPPPDLSQLEAQIAGLSSRVILVDTPPIGISSSDIRHRVAQGLSIRYLVPQAVERYILAHGLYR